MPAFDPYRWGRGDTLRRTTSEIPVEVRDLVTVRQRGKHCVQCKAFGLIPPDDVPLELDHLQPLSLGGTNHFSNLQWLCRSHNRGRGNRKRAPSIPRWRRRRGLGS